MRGQGEAGLRAEATDKYGQVGVSPEVFFSVTNPATPWLPGVRVDGPAPIPYKVHGQTQFMPPVIQDGFLAVTGAVYQVQGTTTNPASYRILITTPEGKVVRQTGWLTATQTTAFALYTNDLTTVCTTCRLWYAALMASPARWCGSSWKAI